MSVTQPSDAGHTAVLLPGTGSDDHFVREVFTEALAAVGVRLLAPAPVPGPDLVTAHLAALDEAARRGPVIVGGISLGAHVAAEWAVDNLNRCAGLLLALPGWTGAAEGAPGAATAAHGAADVRARGTEAALRSAVAGVDAWLADELTRAWTGHGDGLADSLAAAADRAAPTEEQLATLDVPAGVATCLDDPVHPSDVARAWVRALPNAALCTTRLEVVGVDRAALGRAAVLGLLRARAA
ncbi:alpha/beta hydrolase [Actinokineospora sp. PR83]|uniref:alpha/beta fold hydrolase n=1 Tax=Actinokineospora sp. PR83 TaxID=2884908 RepID=UPI001F3A5995|nr:alpha/beta hydrolase [Actinokineospora sp. PR83]MCG8918083.1 alpha/beta hydrolase [Actinokineospora sp. PR83]